MSVVARGREWGAMCKLVQYQRSEEMLGAFESEAVPHMKALFRVAMCLERDRNKAEALVQETFIQALQIFHRFEPGENCCAWLVSIMYGVKRNRQSQFSLLH
jgi:DNA-directed RNA polymerase specialized sigma24 family protein